MSRDDEVQNEVGVKTEEPKDQPRVQETITREEMTMAKNKFPFDIEITGTERIPISARNFIVTLGEVPTDQLRLDPTNQRLSWRIKVTGTKPTEENLMKLMWEDMGYVKPLMHSIQTNGGLLEAIIVRHNGSVVEGNCRLTCYRKLQELYEEDERWRHIRCRVLPEEVAEEEIQVILGELHVAGKHEWNALEEAEFVYKMISGPWGMRREELAKILRKSKSTIQNMVEAWRLMSEKYLEKYTETHRINDYSYFLEFYKGRKKFPETYQDPIEFRALEEEFVDWVGTDQLTKGVQVRDLSDILANERALEALREATRKGEDGKGYFAATAVLEAEHPEYKVKLYKVMARMIEELQNAPLAELQQLREGDGGRISIVEKLKASLEEFMKEAGMEVEV